MEEYKKTTIESYNKHAGYFSEKFRQAFAREERDEFSKFMNFLDGKKILDLGCGDGEHGVHFKKSGFDVTGVDLSDSFLEIARKNGLNVVKMDIEDLKFEENSFDGIWAVTSLLHIPRNKIAGVIDKLSSILKDKGILYVCVKEGEGEGLVTDSNDPGTRRFFVYWQKDDLLGLFKDRFTLLNYRRVNVGKTVFLEFFFENKKSSKVS